jgi:hypothetical protein
MTMLSTRHNLTSKALSAVRLRDHTHDHAVHPSRPDSESSISHTPQRSQPMTILSTRHDLTSEIPSAVRLQGPGQ